MKNLYIDMDGTITEFRYLPLSEIKKEGYFAGLAPIEKNLKELREIAASGKYHCYILSAVLPDSIFAENEKRDWLKKNFPEVEEANCLFPKCGEDKAVYIGRALTENDILIDDRTVNLNKWEDAGGSGIKILNSINGIGGTYKGPRVKIEKGGELSDIIKAL